MCYFSFLLFTFLRSTLLLKLWLADYTQWKKSILNTIIRADIYPYIHVYDDTPYIILGPIVIPNLHTCGSIKDHYYYQGRSNNSYKVNYLFYFMKPL